MRGLQPRGADKLRYDTKVLICKVRSVWVNGKYGLIIYRSNILIVPKLFVITDKICTKIAYNHEDNNLPIWQNAVVIK